MNKKFPLSGVLKVREYKYELARRVFLNETKADRLLADKYQNIENDVQKVISQVDQGYKSIDEMRYFNEFLSSSRVEKQRISAQREAIKDKIKAATDKYQIVHKELESIKILESNHNKEIKKLENKHYFRELQERITCSK